MTLTLDRDRSRSTLPRKPETIQLISRIACPPCEVGVLDMRDRSVAAYLGAGSTGFGTGREASFCVEE
jgi:hypothetical protein